MSILNIEPMVLALISTLIVVVCGVAYTEIRSRREDTDYDWDV